MMRFALPLAALLMSGCTATPAQVARAEADAARDHAKLEQRLAGYSPGKTVGCVRPVNASLDIYGDTLLYRETGARLYRTTTTGGCFGLKRDDIVVTNSTTGQLCRGDIVRTVDRISGIPSGACSFGDFTVYSRDRRG